MHIYKSVSGEPLPSVTHIIEKTKPLSEVIRMNKAIEAKREREGKSKEDAKDSRQIAADRGTIIHGYHEHFWKTGGLNGGDLQTEKWNEGIDCNINPYTSHPYTAGDFLMGFNDYLKDLRVTAEKVELVASEIPVVSEKYQYGGRLDLLLNIDGKNHLFDLKTSNGYFHQYQQRMIYLLEKWRKPKSVDVKVTNELGKKVKERSKEEFPEENQRDWSHVSHWVKDKYLQLAMYRIATMESGYKVDRVNLLILFPNHRYQLITVPNRVYVGCHKEAVDRIQQFWQTEGDRWRLMMKEKELLSL